MRLRSAVTQCPQGAVFSLLRIDPCPAVPSSATQLDAPGTPCPRRAPFGASCWSPFIHHQGPEALTQAAGVLPAVGETREHVVKYITQKNTGRRPASTLEASPGSLLSLYNFRCVGLTICLLELLSNKRKDGRGNGRQSYTSL